MVILVRSEGENYQCETGLADLFEIANGVKEIPAEWISEDGVSMSAKFIKYCQPSSKVRCRFLMRMECLPSCAFRGKESARFWILTNSRMTGVKPDWPAPSGCPQGILQGVYDQIGVFGSDR